MELSESFFATAAGWEVMKQARALLAQGKVLESQWNSPRLSGVVQEGDSKLRAGLLIRDAVDIENLCPCRQSRERGALCAHSVAIGLHHLSPPPLRVPDAPPTEPVRTVEAASPIQINPEAERCLVHVILAPNWKEGLLRDKVSLYFEAETGSDRMQLATLPLDRAYSLDPFDASLIPAMAALAQGSLPSYLMLSGAQFALLLDKLALHPRVTVGKKTPVEIHSEPAPFELRAELEADGTILLTVTKKPSGTQLLMIGKKPWMVSAQSLRPWTLSPALVPVWEKPLRIARETVPLFLGNDWPPLQSVAAIDSNFRLEDFELASLTPRVCLELSGGIARLEAELSWDYGSFRARPFVPVESLFIPDPQKVTRFSARDVSLEQESLGRLLKAGFQKQPNSPRLLLSGQESVLEFFARVYPRMRNEWQVQLEERLQQSTQKNLEWTAPSFQIQSSGVQWFDLAITYDTPSGERVPPSEIQRLLRSGQSHFKLRNGRHALVDTGALQDFQEVLRDCDPRQQGDAYKMSQIQSGFLAATLQEHPEWKLQAPAAWKQRGGQGSVEIPPLGPLENLLRPYQKEGVRWLWFLRQNGLGGILADEMGLGKTVQALAFLESLRPGRTLPHLVICPTSLVWNWVEEARRFTPGLKVLVLHGPSRAQSFEQVPQHDLVITTYGLIRRDSELYQRLEFDTVLLDEAQHIKNRQSQNAQSVKSIRCRHRIVLTGTPLENSVLDLWSIFEFLMPGYLGAAQDFRERYELPISREKDPAVESRLARRVRPFLLRRLKREVAPELPEKIEQVLLCDLSAEQKGIYDQLLQATRKQVEEVVGQQGFARSRMIVLSALLRLRQLCCDARLLQLDTPLREPSGKWELFSELLEEIIDGGHRVLVFSQFVTMLKLLSDKLTAESVPFCYLDGASIHRQEIVGRFQNSAAIPVFLISLKAGGVGLNLTGADTVIHFDPWWNPAVEDQATGRAHRIGQSKLVTSYKLITRGTIEEKIILLQNRKKEIFDNLMAGEEGVGAAMNWEDVQELLA